MAIPFDIITGIHTKCLIFCDFFLFQETTAKEVVMLSLQEFGITEASGQVVHQCEHRYLEWDSSVLLQTKRCGTRCTRTFIWDLYVEIHHFIHLLFQTAPTPLPYTHTGRHINTHTRMYASTHSLSKQIQIYVGRQVLCKCM